MTTQHANGPTSMTRQTHTASPTRNVKRPRPAAALHWILVGGKLINLDYVTRVDLTHMEEIRDEGTQLITRYPGVMVQFSDGSCWTFLDHLTPETVQLRQFILQEVENGCIQSVFGCPRATRYDSQSDRN